MNESLNKNFLTKFIQIILLLLLSSALPAYAKNIHYQDRIVVDDNYIKKHGNVITGNYQSDASGPAILVSNASTPVYIVNSNLQGPTNLISIINSNVSVMNTTGVGTYPLTSGVAKGMFINASNPVNLVVSNCTITDVSLGIYVNGYSGSSSVSNTITISNNTFNNIDARPSNGSGGYVTNGNFNGHAIQLNNVFAVPGITISWNQIINDPFVSATGQMIEMIDASGTSASPILIHDNYLQGAYPADPGVDSYTGGGIITNGTSMDSTATTTAFVNIYNNQVVSTANVGIAIAAGHDINVYNNTVVSSGYLSNGTFFPMTYANGMYNWNYYQLPPTVFYNNNMFNNTVGLIANNGSGAPTRQDWYFPDQPNPEGNMDWQPYTNTSPTVLDEQNQYAAWQAKLNNNSGTGIITPPTLPTILRRH